MKKGGGRLKGNSFEREVAGLIVKAFCDFGIKKKHCYRTPSSGGHRYAKSKDPGDLVMSGKLRKMFPFSPECKFYRRIDLFSLYTPIEEHKKSSQFKQWLKQTCLAAKGTHRHPLLIFKQNRSVILCAFPEGVPKSVTVKLVSKGKPCITFVYNDHMWYVFRFDQFLRQVVREARHADNN